MSLIKLSKEEELEFKKWWNSDKDVAAWKMGMMKDQTDQLVKEGYSVEKAKKIVKPPSYDYPQKLLDKGEYYDYRKAWKAGDRPILNKKDGKRHWSSVGKSENHPTKWKQDFFNAFGFDPDDQNVTRKQGMSALKRAEMIQILGL